jgi:hypothetical protein
MANTIGGNLLKYLGLVGSSGLHTGSLVPRAATPNANQELFRDFEKAGDVADPDIWTRYNTVMKRPTTFDSMLQLWDEMSSWDLMAAALVEIVDEATQVDQNSPATLWYQCNDREFEEELNDMVVGLNIEDLIQSQVWHIAALGNHFEKIEYAPGEGVMGLSFVHPIDMRRYWLERNRKCIGYRWTGHKPSKEAAFVMPDNKTPVERVSIANGKDIEDLWYPWDFMHFRRMYRLRISEHGEPIFEEAQGIYKKLRIAIDQMVVHRAQVQPDRYAINIDVQEQPPIEQMKTVQRWKQALRSKLAFGQSGDQNALNAATDFASYYNAMSLDTILYVAQPKGFHHTVDKIAGTTQVPDVYDIELLTDLFYSIIGMPRSWFGGQKDQQTAPSGKALLAQDMRFLRKIKSIRRPIIQAYTWLAYFHAVLKGKNISSLDIKAMMPPIGSLEDQMKLEMLKMQTEVLDMLADVMAKYNLPKEAWVETIFKRYLHLPDEIVNIFITSLPAPVDGADVMAEGLSPAPREHILIREVDEQVNKSARFRLIVENLKDTARSYQVKSGIKTFTQPGRLLEMPTMRTNDIIISSFGKHPLELKQTDPANPLKRSAQPLQEAMNNAVNGNDGPPDSFGPYRKWMPNRF